MAACSRTLRPWARAASTTMSSVRQSKAWAPFRGCSDRQDAAVEMIWAPAALAFVTSRFTCAGVSSW